MAYESPDLTHFRHQATPALTQAAPIWREYRRARQAMDATCAAIVRTEPSKRDAQLPELTDWYDKILAAAWKWDQAAEELFRLEQEFRHADGNQTHLWNLLDLAPELNLDDTDRHMDPFADSRRDGYFAPHLTGKVQGAIAWQKYNLKLDGPPRQEWNGRDALGTHPFDPRANTDQGLAEAVLDRIHPTLRYAQDTGTWLIRKPQHWEARGNLTEWAVTAVAVFAPPGDPSADKDSIEYKREQRRTRLNNSSPSSAIASKMRAKVTGSFHPSTVTAADLDADPEVLWAGGIPWDLRASSDAPVPAGIHPDTPHLHSAAVVPQARPTPLWDAFCAAVWPDPQVRAWALRVLSIALTGYPDAALPILAGPTRRGKTQIVDLLANLLGSYAHAADPRLLSGADTAHASIVYALKGRRLSFIDEGPRESRWGQERLKQLTGGAALTGNRMGENPITFQPSHTLVLTTNDEPPLTDPAIRRRVRLIPCEGDQEAVRTAREAIGHTRDPAWQAEAPGVLAAMMREAAAWLADPDSGTTEAAPDSIRDRADEIAEEQDPIRIWLEAETEPFEQGTQSTLLYEAFRHSCRELGIPHGRIPSKSAWGSKLTLLGHPKQHRRDGKYRPLKLRDY